RDGHGGVIEPEEQLVGRLLPGCIAFPGWEIDQLESVTFRIMEFDCPHPRGARVRGRDSDWVRGNLLDVVVLQDLVSGIHVSHDDGHVLEPLVVALGWYRDWTARGRRDILRELYDLIAQPQMDDTHAGVEHALQFAVFGADQAEIDDLFEVQ